MRIATSLAAMEPFVAAFNAFHDNLAPRDWLEGLMKTYVGDGITADFYREVAGLLDGDEREIVLSVLTDAQESDFIVARLREAIDADGIDPLHFRGDFIGRADEWVTPVAAREPLL